MKKQLEEFKEGWNIGLKIMNPLRKVYLFLYVLLPILILINITIHWLSCQKYLLKEHVMNIAVTEQTFKKNLKGTEKIEVVFSSYEQFISNLQEIIVSDLKEAILNKADLKEVLFTIFGNASLLELPFYILVNPAYIEFVSSKYVKDLILSGRVGYVSEHVNVRKPNFKTIDNACKLRAYENIKNRNKTTMNIMSGLIKYLSRDNFVSFLKEGYLNEKSSSYVNASQLSEQYIDQEKVSEYEEYILNLLKTSYRNDILYILDRPNLSESYVAFQKRLLAAIDKL